MASAFRLQCHCILIFLAALKGETRYLEVSNATDTYHNSSHLLLPSSNAQFQV